MYVHAHSVSHCTGQYGAYCVRPSIIVVLYCYYSIQDDYQTYLSHRADKRQSLIISLNDYNQQQLKEIAAEKEQMLSEHEEKKAGKFAVMCSL